MVTGCTYGNRWWRRLTRSICSYCSAHFIMSGVMRTTLSITLSSCNFQQLTEWMLLKIGRQGKKVVLHALKSERAHNGQEWTPSDTSPLELSDRALNHTGIKSVVLGKWSSGLGFTLFSQANARLAGPDNVLSLVGRVVKSKLLICLDLWVNPDHLN